MSWKSLICVNKLILPSATKIKDLILKNRRQFINFGAHATLLATLVNVPAWAQAFESVKVLVGFAPGGANDLVARNIANKMGNSLYVKGAALVDNRTGASGQIACTALKSAPNDGSIILCSPFSCTALYPHVYKSLSYDPLTDFVSVSKVASFPLAISIGPAVPLSVKSLQEYIAWVKGDVKLRGLYGTTGAGSIAHFVGAHMAIESGLDMGAVAYRGSAPAIVDVIGGQIPAILTGITDLLPHAKGGKIRILATSGASRNNFLPDIPTYSEQGFTQIIAEEVVAFHLPSKTPRSIIDAANLSINFALKDPDVIKALGAVGLTVGGSTPEELDKLLISEYARWGRLIKRIGFTAQS